jgi:hypothetical protein
MDSNGPPSGTSPSPIHPTSNDSSGGDQLNPFGTNTGINSSLLNHLIPPSSSIQISPFIFSIFTTVEKPLNQWPFTNRPQVITTPNHKQTLAKGPRRYNAEIGNQFNKVGGLQGNQISNVASLLGGNQLNNARARKKRSSKSGN